jgi:hypothetical protein
MKRQFPRLNILRHMIIPVVTALLLTIVWFLFITFIHFTVLLSTQLLPYVLAIMIGAVVALPGLAHHASRKVSAILLGIFCMATIGYDFVAPDERKPFVVFYQDIRPGMTITQVQQKLDQHYPPNGQPIKPVITPSEPDRFVIFLNPNDRRWNEITMLVKDGKVVNTAYIDD